MSSTPVRLRLSRQRGFDLQALSRATNGLDAVAVARPSKWGNPHKVGEFYNAVNEGDGSPTGRYRCESTAEAVQCFREWVEHFVDDIREDLRGKNLACWCAPGAPCHADVLLELANL